LKERKLGGLEGQIRMSEDFDEEDEEFIDAMWSSPKTPSCSGPPPSWS